MTPDKNSHISSETLDRLMNVVGHQNALTGEEDIEPFVTEWRGRYGGATNLVLKPANREEVSQILKIANETNSAIVPQGGNTGLVGGQMPDQTGNEIVINLSRLNKVRQVDTLNNTITVEAGCILETIQNLAHEQDRLFPLSLGAEGSCQIGGNLSSNAGGTNVLKYGSTRELCLGLEVVLANGEIWHGLNKLRKNNTGYDLKNLFIGAEGTLGIITAAVMKLSPRPIDTCTSIVAVPSPRQAIDLLHLAQKLSGDIISGFELMPRIGLEFVLRHIDGTRDPLENSSPWYVLMELTGGVSPDSLTPFGEKILEIAFEKELITDAVMASNTSQSQAFWQLRLALSEVQKIEGGSIKNDVSVPISKIDQFIEKADELMSEAIPGSRPVPFGHIGDGNIHYNISQPKHMEKSTFLAQDAHVNKIIYDLVLSLGGSISAEHGIGRIKAHLMEDIKSPIELELMQNLKSTLDPKNILNPGKVLPYNK